MVTEVSAMFVEMIHFRTPSGATSKTYEQNEKNENIGTPRKTNAKLLFTSLCSTPLVLHFTSLCSTPLVLVLHFTSLHSTPFTSLHFPPLHSTPLPFTSLHFTSLHYILSYIILSIHSNSHLILLFNRQSAMQRQNNPALSLLCILFSSIHYCRYLRHPTQKNQ